MKKLILLIIPILLSMTDYQINLEFEECVKSGKEAKDCKLQLRNKIRQLKEKKVQTEKIEKTQANREKFYEMLEESEHGSKYVFTDPSSGKQIDIRNLSQLDRAKFECTQGGGVWSGKECKGQLAKIKNNKIKQSGNNQLLNSMMDESLQDEQMRLMLEQQLNEKEMIRKQKKEYRDWVKKIAKVNNMRIEDVEIFAAQNPQAFDQAVSQLQQQEILDKQKEREIFEKAYNLDPDKGQEVSKTQAAPVEDPNMYADPNYYPVQEGQFDQQYYEQAPVGQ